MIHGESYKPIVAEAAKTPGPRERLRADLRLPPAEGPRHRAGIRGDRVLRAREQGLRVQGRGRHLVGRRCHRRLPPPRRGERGSADLVRAVEHRLGLRAHDQGRRGDDADGAPPRRHALQDGYGPVGMWFLLFKGRSRTPTVSCTRSIGPPLDEVPPYGAARPIPHATAQPPDAA